MKVQFSRIENGLEVSTSGAGTGILSRISNVISLSNTSSLELGIIPSAGGGEEVEGHILVEFGLD